MFNLASCMQTGINDTRKFKVEIIIREDCKFSNNTLNSLLSVRKYYSGMTLEVINIAECPDERKSLGGITPSIWVNDKLWFLGSFSLDNFHSRLSILPNNLTL